LAFEISRPRQVWIGSVRIMDVDDEVLLMWLFFDGPFEASPVERGLVCGLLRA
jgi:hypothetical protein